MRRTMELAYEEESKSSCVSRKVGSVLVLNDGEVISSFNDLPTQTNSTCGEERLCRCFNPNRVSGKDLENCFAIHSEARCISIASEKGLSTKNGIIVTTTLPCMECAKLIINSGIKEVIYDKKFPHEKVFWLFDKAKVKLTHLSTKQ
jgi:dCMP deaminase